MKIDDPSFDFHGSIGINRKQSTYYNLQPFSQALIVIVDHYSSIGMDKVVHLIQTSIPTDFYTPIPFRNISPKLASNTSLQSNSNNTITTTLSAAVAFITNLLSRPKTAFPKHQQNSNIIDKKSTNPEHFTRAAQCLGYTGPEIAEASSSWAKLAEGEDMLSPLTPGVMRM